MRAYYIAVTALACICASCSSVVSTQKVIEVAEHDDLGFAGTWESEMEETNNPRHRFAIEGPDSTGLYRAKLVHESGDNSQDCAWFSVERISANPCYFIVDAVFFPNPSVSYDGSPQHDIFYCHVAEDRLQILDISTEKLLKQLKQDETKITFVRHEKTLVVTSHAAEVSQVLERQFQLLVGQRCNSFRRLLK